MSWILFTVISAVLFTSAELVDKFILDHELKDPVLATIFNGIGTFVLFSIVALLFGYTPLPADIIVLCIIIGAVYNGGLMLFFFAMREEEVSRFSPVLSTLPVFTLLFAYVFLGETFPAVKYIGIALIVAGAILISFKKFRHKIRVAHAFYLILISSLFLALRNVMIKYATIKHSFWPIMFWIGMGGLLLTAVIFIMRHPHIRKQWEVGIRHTVFIGGVTAGGFLFLALAIEKGTASLVSALVAAKPLLVFLSATALSIFYPRFLKEKITRGILLQKTIAVILILAGSLLIV